MALALTACSSPLADSAEAKAELARLVREQEPTTYEAWRKAIVDDRDHQHHEFHGPSGQWYQYDVDAFWDDEAEGAIRVIVCIDDGGESAYRPLCEGILVEKPRTTE